MSNRLAQCTSPYLLQHAQNPVHWQPWDEEALALARRERKPIFLSIGYSACHWCHVMEHESFEDPLTAAVLNAHFISIKVDREERPDLDDLYMGAVQAIAGRSGWPMSVWLTPELEPFYGGTYFPKEAHYGMPGFRALLERIAKLWREQRGDLLEDARRLVATLERQQGQEGEEDLRPDLADQALIHLRQQFDANWGGFGGAPKFPPHLALELIFRRGTEKDQAMALRTLDAMWEGGLYDHLGGGFARYSVDEQWLVPHFEKMLYDNAQLVPCYLEAYRITGNERCARIARETLDYLLRDMRDEAGGFHSAEDADSEGHEGLFYTFTPPEVREVLGEDDARFFCEALGVSSAGDLEGRSVLHRFPVKALDETRLDALRSRMLEARAQRVRPGKDDKILTSWNALAIRAFALGHQVLGDSRYGEAAEKCAAFLRKEMWREGVLLRSWRHGQAHTPGFLEDYAALAEALVDLFETTFDAAWLRWSEELIEALRARFRDEAGGFFYTEADRSDVLLRQKPVFDGSIPSANALAARALLRLARHLDRDDLRAEAEGILRCFSSSLNRAPMALLGLLEALDLLRSESLDIVISGSLLDPRTQELLQTAWRSRRYGRYLTCVIADPDLPLHVGKANPDGPPVAHVCRDRACQAPVKNADDLRLMLR